MATRDGEPDRAGDALRRAHAEIRRLEEALARTEERAHRLGAAHDASFDPMVILRPIRDGSGQIVDFEYDHANAAALRFLRRPLDEVLGSRLLSLLPGHREHRDLFERFVRVVESGVPEEVELDYVGEGIEGSFRNVAAKLEDGVVLFFHDITEERRKARAVEESEAEHRLLAERYGGLVEALAEIVWTLDPEGKIVDDVPTGRRLTGQTAAEVRGYGWLDAVHPEDRPEVLRVIEGGRDEPKPLTLSFRLRTATGAYRYMAGRAVPLFEKDGSVREWVGVCIDEDERRRAEEALRESESFLKLAQQSAHMGVWALDLERRTARWSIESYALYGRDPSLPSPGYEEWLSMIHPEDRPGVDEVARRVMSGAEDSWRIQFRILHPERGERWLLEAGQRSGRHAAGVTLDVTEQKRAEERLREVVKMEAVGRLAGGLAHDFNNQLQVIRGFASVVGRDPGLGARAREHLGEIGRAAERMGSLTSQLLAFSRRQVLRLESIDLDAAVLEDEPMLSRLIGSQIRTRLELGPGEKWVRVDRAQLLQVLMNLAINARDAMPRGGDVVIRTSLRDVREKELDEVVGEPVAPGRYVELSVDDSGEGIAPELLRHVFEPFFTTKEVGRGTGLGLATVHGIVAQTRGHVWVTSKPGRGTRVALLLPVTEEAPKSVPLVKETTIEEARGGRILVVEDERAVRRFLVEALMAEGFEVCEAENGREALARLEAVHGAVDLVVSDVVMPVMGGAELGRELARLHPDVPVLWMSGYTREAAFGSNAHGKISAFLQKPVSVATLRDAVHRALASKERPAGATKPFER